MRARELALQVTEKEFQGQVVRLARLLGWRHYHTWGAYRSVPGFPDLILVRRDRIVVAELKSEQGRITADQQEWLRLFRETGKVEVYIWRPSDWTEIEQVLA